MPKEVSAGLLMYRLREQRLEVLLGHPGGPYFVRKDRGSWGIPKGGIDPGEDPLTAAVREFGEETGIEAQGPFLSLGGVKYRNHKVVYAWAFAGDCDPGRIVSNTFEMEWPRGSGKRQEFPEIDRAAFFDIPTARQMIMPAQARFLDDLEARVALPLVDPQARLF
jgi:predicted NUDIX family NTP pyrophosphohydrolase